MIRISRWFLWFLDICYLTLLLCQINRTLLFAWQTSEEQFDRRFKMNLYICKLECCWSVYVHLLWLNVIVIIWFLYLIYVFLNYCLMPIEWNIAYIEYLTHICLFYFYALLYVRRYYVLNSRPTYFIYKYRSLCEPWMSYLI